MDSSSADDGFTLQTLEEWAEVLVVSQLDLLVQVEAQVRAVHHTMRRIEKLRATKSRVGSELSTGQRRDTLDGLMLEIDSLDAHLLTQHECCRDMHALIEKMQALLSGIKHSADQSQGARPNESTDPEPITGGQEPPENDAVPLTNHDRDLGGEGST